MQVRQCFGFGPASLILPHAHPTGEDLGRAAGLKLQYCRAGSIYFPLAVGGICTCALKAFMLRRASSLLHRLPNRVASDFQLPPPMCNKNDLGTSTLLPPTSSSLPLPLPSPASRSLLALRTRRRIFGALCPAKTPLFSSAILDRRLPVSTSSLRRAPKHGHSGIAQPSTKLPHHKATHPPTPPGLHQTDAYLHFVLQIDYWPRNYIGIREAE